MQDLEKGPGIAFRANLAAIRSDARTGGWKLVLDAFAIETEAIQKAMPMINQNIQVAIVLLPEGN